MQTEWLAELITMHWCSYSFIVCRNQVMALDGDEKLWFDPAGAAGWCPLWPFRRMQQCSLIFQLWASILCLHFSACLSNCCKALSLSPCERLTEGADLLTDKYLNVRTSLVLFCLKLKRDDETTAAAGSTPHFWASLLHLSGKRWSHSTSFHHYHYQPHCLRIWLLYDTDAFTVRKAAQ